MLLGLSLGANVVLLLGVVGLLLLGRAGFFAPGGPGPAANASGVSTAGSALGTTTPTGSPQPGAGWLQVTPGSITLKCGGDQGTHSVMLTNTGPQPVQWQADLSLPHDQAGVTVNPNQGQLDAGASMQLQIQTQTHTHGDQGGSGQQGTIRFTTDSTAAGLAPSVSYTTTSCQ